MCEFHTSHTGTNDGDALGENAWRIAITGCENSVSVWLSELRDTRTSSRGDENVIGLNLVRRSVACIDMNSVGIQQTCRSANDGDALALQQRGHVIGQAVLDALNAVGQRIDVDFSIAIGQAHSAETFRETHGPTGSNHGF